MFLLAVFAIVHTKIRGSEKLRTLTIVTIVYAVILIIVFMIYSAVLKNNIWVELCSTFSVPYLELYIFTKRTVVTCYVLLPTSFLGFVLYKILYIPKEEAVEQVSLNMDTPFNPDNNQ